MHFLFHRYFYGLRHQGLNMLVKIEDMHTEIQEIRTIQDCVGTLILLNCTFCIYFFSDLICKVFNFSVNQEVERLPTGILCDYPVSLGGMSKGTQDRETSAHSPHAVCGSRQPYHIAPFENGSGFTWEAFQYFAFATAAVGSCSRTSILSQLEIFQFLG